MVEFIIILLFLIKFKSYVASNQGFVRVSVGY